MSLSKIYTTEEPKDLVYIAMSYNINCAVLAEKDEKTKFLNRLPRIVAMIHSIKPHILLLQECRKLDDSSATEIMKYLPEYTFTIHYFNPSDLSLALIIAYRTDSFMSMQSGTKWLSLDSDFPSDDWGDGWGRAFAYAHLKPIVNKKVLIHRDLFVFNTHLGLKAEEKFQSLLLIPNLMKKISGGKPCFAGGDCNIFYDDDGFLHEKIPTQHPDFPLEHWSDSYIDQNGKSAIKTYVPYTYEKMYEKLIGMERNTLDHFYAYDLKKLGAIIADSRTMMDPEPSGYVPDSTPSDHYPIYIKFGFNNM